MIGKIIPVYRKSISEWNLGRVTEYDITQGSACVSFGGYAREWLNIDTFPYEKYLEAKQEARVNIESSASNIFRKPSTGTVKMDGNVIEDASYDPIMQFVSSRPSTPVERYLCLASSSYDVRSEVKMATSPLIRQEEA